MNKLSYAILGSGMMGHEHIRNILLQENTEVTAVADPNTKMRETAIAFSGGKARGFTDYRDLLASKLADVLVIASPNYTHIDVLADAMNCGLPILVEKPLCTTLEDCNKILELAKDYPAPIWVGMEYRYMPPVELLIRAVHDFKIGNLKMLSIKEHRFPFLNKVNDWNRFSIKTGGTLVEKCCHFFDLMRLITRSEPLQVYASGGQVVNHLDEQYGEKIPDVLDHAFVIVDFKSGVRAMLELCMFSEGSYFQEEITVIGDSAKFVAQIPGPTRFWPGKEERHSQVTFSPRNPKQPVREEVEVDKAYLTAGDHHGSTFFQHKKFCATVRFGNLVEVTLDDGREAVRIGAAAEESVRTGRPVTLN
jgi:myo-inositol 2-dehydrogenase / D-chiro-inositol 1-dehydrogenase